MQREEIDEIVNDVPVFPNEIFSYIINLTYSPM